MTWIRARVVSTADDLKRSLADRPGAAKIRHPEPLIAL
jgi:hypothetical protein